MKKSILICAMAVLASGISPTGTLGAGGSFGVSAFKYEVSNVAATPIPPALPLFVSALGGLGFLGWRRKVTTV